MTRNPYQRLHRVQRLRVARGFTMVELMIAVAIAAILALLAAPSLSALVARHQARSVASELYFSLAKARSEAVTRNANVSVSPKAGNWQNGWQIADPANAANILDDRGAATGATITGSLIDIVFGPSGRVRNATVPQVVISVSAGSTSAYQCVSVELSGRPYITAASSC